MHDHISSCIIASKNAVPIISYELMVQRDLIFLKNVDNYTVIQIYPKQVSLENCQGIAYLQN